MFIIDLLYIKDCQGKKRALSNLQRALNDLGFNEKQYFISEKEIKNEKEAKLWKLAGSPTIKVNGVDIEENNYAYGLYSRRYHNDSPAPDVKDIKNSLRMDIRERAKAKKDILNNCINKSSLALTSI